MSSNVKQVFCNDLKELVKDATNSFCSINSDLVQNIGMGVIARKDFKTMNQVAIISGGGAGHEPAHCGFVGQGCLTAAVSGEIFASPSTDQVFHAIETVTNKEFGALLIVKNYTGDRLNFGMAAEKAKTMGIRVEFVVVAEDCVESESIDSITGARGLAGVLFVHKIAGALASQGKSLQEIVSYLEDSVLNRLGTLGVSLYPGCTVPGRPLNDRINSNQMELGLGIHGEAGMSRMDTVPEASKIAQSVCDQILSKKCSNTDKDILVLVNNLGTSSFLEHYLFAGEVLKYLIEKGKSVKRFLLKTWMTSLDMHGLSVTILPLEDANMVSLIDYPCKALAWLDVRPIEDVKVVQQTLAVFQEDDEDDAEQVKKKQKICNNNPGRLEKCIRAGIQKLKDETLSLDELDAITGDGDCGSTLAKGCDAVLHFLDTLYDEESDTDYTVLLSKLGDIAASIGGTSGAIYCLFFRGTIAAIKNQQLPINMAFRDGVQSVQKYARSKEGMRTLLDALIPATNSKTIAEAAIKAHQGSAATKYMKATAGRSANVPYERYRGSVDPGAEAVSLFLAGFASQYTDLSSRSFV